ncbi:hypothetical protein [Inquilinus limosus]|uniref:hypothetical protein n=1 Tax=Inquilinus limosus TaxID=171674 RepID=UPI000B48AAE1|nr:hypothetical protein [Inquilinus limosus]
MTSTAEEIAALGARTVVLEHGSRRVLVMDSISFATVEDAGQVVVTGSHGGSSAGEYAAGVAPAVVVCNDAGFGKGRAGVAGMAALDGLGVMALAVSHASARIGDGMDSWRSGVISFANKTAIRGGFRLGDDLAPALARHLEQPATPPRTLQPSPRASAFRTVVHEAAGRRVVAMDSISFITPEDRGQIVVAGSNGGMASGLVARQFQTAFVALNDAGIGKEEAGIAGLAAIDALAIAGVGISNDSAAISDGRDTWENGVISYANNSAHRLGFRLGARLKESVLQALDSL